MSSPDPTPQSSHRVVHLHPLVVRLAGLYAGEDSERGFFAAEIVAGLQPEYVPQWPKWCLDDYNDSCSEVHPNVDHNAYIAQYDRGKRVDL